MTWRISIKRTVHSTNLSSLPGAPPRYVRVGRVAWVAGPCDLIDWHGIQQTSTPPPHPEPNSINNRTRTNTHRHQMFVKEIVVNALFVLGFLVLPEILSVNRRPTWWAWLALLPLLRCQMPDQGACVGDGCDPSIGISFIIDRPIFPPTLPQARRSRPPSSTPCGSRAGARCWIAAWTRFSTSTVRRWF